MTPKKAKAPSFTLKDITYLQDLTRLTVTKGESTAIMNDLNSTLNEVGTLDDVDTKNVSATFQTSGTVNRFQAEKPGEREMPAQGPFTVTTHFYEQ